MYLNAMADLHKTLQSSGYSGTLAELAVLLVKAEQESEIAAFLMVWSDRCNAAQYAFLERLLVHLALVFDSVLPSTQYPFTGISACHRKVNPDARVALRIGRVEVLPGSVRLIAYRKNACVAERTLKF